MDNRNWIQTAEQDVGCVSDLLEFHWRELPVAQPHCTHEQKQQPHALRQPRKLKICEKNFRGTDKVLTCKVPRIFAWSLVRHRVKESHAIVRSIGQHSITTHTRQQGNSRFSWFKFSEKKIVVEIVPSFRLFPCCFARCLRFPLICVPHQSTKSEQSSPKMRGIQGTVKIFVFCAKLFSHTCQWVLLRFAALSPRLHHRVAETHSQKNRINVQMNNDQKETEVKKGNRSPCQERRGNRSGLSRTCGLSVCRISPQSNT